MALATFAGGCFWCMVGPFAEREGVITVTSGYTGGETENPSYEEVCSNTTGHVEAVQIEYDSEIISYKELLDIFGDKLIPLIREDSLMTGGSLIKLQSLCIMITSLK